MRFTGQLGSLWHVYPSRQRGVSRRAMLLGGLATGVAGGSLPGQAEPGGWDQILRDGRRQEVFFHAWGGDERINAFIAWAAARVRGLYGVQLHHVKLPDPHEAVARVAAEKAAGRVRDGSVDLVWVAGDNLLAMRADALLDGPVFDLLPAARLVSREDKPATVRDRMVPLDGFAVPWRMEQLVFLHDPRTNPDPPRDMPALLDWALRHPGRLTHTDLRDPAGVAFLEQALYELAPKADRLLQPVTGEEFARLTVPLWEWYDRLRPALWQGGRNFPANPAAQRALMQDGQIEMMVSLNPSEAVQSIADRKLPPSVLAYVLERGTIGRCSFLAVPCNAAHRAGALLTADFLLSPEAQARGSDARFVGAPTVLAKDRLSPADYVFFDAVPRMKNLLSDAERGPPVQEPHVSWVTRMIAAWEMRYAA